MDLALAGVAAAAGVDADFFLLSVSMPRPSKKLSSSLKIDSLRLGAGSAVCQRKYIKKTLKATFNSTEPNGSS